MNLMLIDAIAPLVPLDNPQAYLDPGSGSYLIQLLLGGLVGALFIIKAYWGRIRSFFKSLSSRPADRERDD